MPTVDEYMRSLAFEMVKTLYSVAPRATDGRTRIAVSTDDFKSLEQWEITLSKFATTGTISERENEDMEMIEPIDIEVVQFGDQRFYGPNQYASITTVLDADPEKKEGLLGWKLYETKRHLASLIGVETRAVSDELYAQYQNEHPETYQQAVQDAELYMKDYTEYAKDRGNKYHLLSQQYLIRKFGLDHPLYPDVNQPITIDKGTPEGVLFDDTKDYLDRISDIAGIEVPILSDSLRVAGTADIIARFDGVPSIIDLKGSTKAPKPYKRSGWFKQMCFYGIGGQETYDLEGIFGEPVEQLVVICGREDAIGNTRKEKVFKASIDEYHTELLRSIITYRDLQAQSMQQVKENAPW